MTLSPRVFIAVAVAGVALAAVPADLVTTLPGFGTPVTKLYSGYLDAGGALLRRRRASPFAVVA
jgi:hypothetical protein